jgi:putative FmdB family regulatory protein
MPVYEYRCRACGGDFERYLHASTATVACPSCTSGDVARKFSVFGLKSDGSVMPSAMAGGGGCCGGGCSCH